MATSRSKPSRVVQSSSNVVVKGWFSSCAQRTRTQRAAWRGVRPVLGVGAIRPMNGNAKAFGNKAHNGISRHRGAAFGKLDHAGSRCPPQSPR